MLISHECFNDKEIKSQILSRQRSGECEIRKKWSKAVYDTNLDEYLNSNFRELIDYYYVPDKNNRAIDNNKDYLSKQLMKLNIFNVKRSDILKIVKNICSDIYNTTPELFRKKVALSCLDNDEYVKEYGLLDDCKWEDFTNSIKHKNRFHTSLLRLNRLNDLFDNISKRYKADQNKLVLYRSRICKDNESYRKGYLEKDLGIPPLNKLNSSRISAKGVPCLYLSADVETSMHEVKVRKSDRVSVGKFIQIDELSILDFTLFRHLSIFSFDIVWILVNYDVIKLISEEFTRPMRSFDDTLEYVPFQYLCDFARSKGFDGIKYYSSLNHNGINYAIFNDEKFRCVSKDLYSIGPVSISNYTKIL